MPSLTDILRALSDPARWTVICLLAQVEELAQVDLDDLLQVSKPTISYHLKVLAEVGLIGARKQGRQYFLSLHRDVLEYLLAAVNVAIGGSTPLMLPEARIDTDLIGRNGAPH